MSNEKGNEELFLLVSETRDDIMLGHDDYRKHEVILISFVLQRPRCFRDCARDR